jgi:hypothetical protein
MSFVIEDRVFEYETHKAGYERLLTKTPEDLIEEWKIECEMHKIKLDQRRERLEAIGVKFDE